MYNYNALARRALTGEQLEFWLRIENLVQDEISGWSSNGESAWNYYTESGGNEAYNRLLETGNIDLMFHDLEWFESEFIDREAFENKPELLDVTGLSREEFIERIQDITSIMSDRLHSEHDQITSGEFTTLQGNNEDSTNGGGDVSAEIIKGMKSELEKVRQESKELKKIVNELTRFKSEQLEEINRFLDEITKLSQKLKNASKNVTGDVFDYAQAKESMVEAKADAIDSSLRKIINNLG